MKILIILWLITNALIVNAECNQAQLEAEIGVNISILSEGVKAGGNHGYMDEVIINVPKQIEGIPLASMLLTKGEVAAFWIPLAYIIEGETAIATYSGYKEEIKNYEIAVYYENTQCQKSIQKMVYAYNKYLNPTPESIAALRGVFIGGAG